MTDDDRAQWSQHYDYMQWLSITIFITAISILLAYATFMPGPSPGRNVFVCFFGIWLTNLTVWFAAGFRSFRHYLVLQTSDKDLAELLTRGPNKRRMPMWRVFIATFAILNFLWVQRFMEAVGRRLLPYPPFGMALCEVILFVGMILVLFGFLFYAYRVGQTPTYEHWLKIQQKHPD